jgi:hypothetical protein
MIGHSGNQTPNFYNAENDTSVLDGTRTHLLVSNGLEAGDREYARIMNAQPYEWSEEEIQRDLERYQSRPFRLLK